MDPAQKLQSYLSNMTKPLLIVVTGRPASGKTTLSQILSEEIKCPLLSRDRFKEGYINTFQSHPNELPALVDQDIYALFFQTIELLLSKNISLVAEAAFQHKLWHPKLMPLLGKADIRMVICDIAPELARRRFTARMAADAGRERFHGDGAELVQYPDDSLITSYKAPDLPVPTLGVDTTENYNPGITGIIEFIWKDRTR